LQLLRTQIYGDSWPPEFRGIMTLNPSYGGRALIVNITLRPIYFTVLTGIPPFLEKGYYGQLGLLKWILDGSMKMGEGSDFGRVSDLDHVAWLFNFGNYI
jgi:hypothetical protein